jgi:hypothetical protein
VRFRQVKTFTQTKKKIEKTNTKQYEQSHQKIKRTKPERCKPDFGGAGTFGNRIL